MKRILLVCQFLFANIIAAQNVAIGLNRSDFEKTTFEKAIIHFKDGTDIEGVGRLKTIFTSQEDIIIFKVEEKDKDETWTAKDVTGITIISDEGVTDYEYLKTSKSSFAELYEVVTDGSVKLYKKKRISKNPARLVLPTIAANAKGGMNNVANGANNSYEGEDKKPENFLYYLKRESEPYPTKIKDNYIKSFAEYMKDCDVMVGKIKKHEYNFSELKNLVDYYNANCGND